MHRRNIWENADDAAVVRSIADGDETVPTVIVGPVGMVNPSLGLIERTLAEHAAHLLDRGAGSASVVAGEVALALARCRRGMVEDVAGHRRRLLRRAF